MQEKKKYRKHSLDKRLSLVLSILEEGKSRREVSAEHCIDPKELRYWVSMYQQHGVSGLQLETKTHSSASKLYVLEFMESNNLTLPETAVKFKLSPSAIKTWRYLYQLYGFDGLKDKKRGRNKTIVSSKKLPPKKLTDTDTILLELERLRAENAYLKKLQALIQNRKLSLKKKK